MHITMIGEAPLALPLMALATRAGNTIRGNEWMALLPSTRVVRAFASVPAEAFMAVAGRTVEDEPIELAVPLAGDDVPAKHLVSQFMRQLGVEPVDLGPLTVSYAMEPGGPLWGRAVDALEMQECIGWLSGDG
jgi:predicted dinucleotide-binding enzyme